MTQEQLIKSLKEMAFSAIAYLEYDDTLNSGEPRHVEEIEAMHKLLGQYGFNADGTDKAIAATR
jgi:hypothetical protein